MATTTNYSWTKPTVGGDGDAWGGYLNDNLDALDTLLGGVTATEFGILDGATITTTELNYLSGATSNIQNQINAITAEAGQVPNTRLISAGSGLTGGGDLSEDRTISHADTSTQSSVSNSGLTFIQSVAVDDYGHVTSIGSGTVTIPDTGIGVGQSWQTVSRSNNTEYRNTTGKPIMVFATGGSVSGTTSISAYVGVSSGSLIQIGRNDARYGTPSVSFIVPDLHYYKCDAGAGIYSWAELR